MVGVGQQLMYSQLTIQTEDGLSHCCPTLRTSQSWERGVSIGYIAMVLLLSGKKPILTAINYFTAPTLGRCVPQPPGYPSSMHSDAIDEGVGRRVCSQ